MLSAQGAEKKINKPEVSSKKMELVIAPIVHSRVFTFMCICVFDHCNLRFCVSFVAMKIDLLNGL